ncbi:DUF6746 family protein [Roseinatronobacter sp.]|uniref:DUF6746 family protein n=1 Tax=Roseinatronobacter sp. TaxID=1945755 RepID=UPI0025CC962E|nr:DUF6746 family protein [Roseibaca sp.]
MKLLAPLAFVALLAATPALSQDAIDHYAPQPSETLEQALANFSEYNKIMADIMTKDSLTPNDMEDVHQLTYTLEVALAKLIEEGTDLAERLEYVHQASEGSNGARLRKYGLDYLETAQKIVP